MTKVELEINGVKRKVVCAANKYGEHIVMGIRHHCPMMNKNIQAIVGDKKEMLELKKADIEGGTAYEDMQGFVDQFGNYLTRKQALYIVVENGQEINWDRNGSTTELYSEGLY